MAKGKDKPKDAKAPAKPPAKGKGKPTAAPAGDDDDAAPAAAPKLKPATAINARHILCAKHSSKEAALERLRAGDAFDAVARDVSEDKARQGGALGWKTRGSLLADFEKVAYALPPSSTGKPVWGECKTGEGYHVIMVEGRR